MCVVEVGVDEVRADSVPCQAGVRSRVHVRDIENGQGAIGVGNKVGVVNQGYSDPTGQ